jgi:hypothetical protein
MPTLSLSLTIFSPQRTQLALLLGDDSSLSNFLRLPPGDTGGLFVFHSGLFQLLMVLIVVAWMRTARRYHADPLLNYAAIVVYTHMTIANYAVQAVGKLLTGLVKKFVL